MEEKLECCCDCESDKNKLMIGLGIALAGTALIALGHFFLCNRKKRK